MEQYFWDGPEDSDEEINELKKEESKWEIDNGLKFSKNGIIKFID